MPSPTLPADTGPLDDAADLAETLRPTLHRLYRRLRREDGEAGLSPLQTLLLTVVMDHPGIGVAELARRENVRGPTISAHVKSLVAAGLLDRASSPHDRRRTGLAVTSQGQATIAALRRRRTDWLAGALARLSPDARQAIRAAIEPLAEIGQ
ncbi:MarR family transcriptional regulator [Gluconacetobacter johannae DSM 13595]|uniref:Winged helix-turn-helix transcriptional regulator n=1 Tax=Gluconacetobacter johannae TaxID=112140 RepID=A0A7W4P7E5_9PROT|nr:MarR family winged helix-turn-helix transcriptional regulator [Gluconacetobacter johannae]MBB2176850.1 winged helix-turn-helix transcriptional regulator [Gluconacetobacter johannae]GBQ86443.1 MarR family transcriptional regulator [Gluconacetobacter johannae DSM 13595]